MRAEHEGAGSSMRRSHVVNGIAPHARNRRPACANSKASPAACRAEAQCGIGAGSGRAQRCTTWLATVNEDGIPHVTAVGTVCSMARSGSKRARAPGMAATSRDPRCSIAASIRDADVIIEGDAARMTDAGIVGRIAEAWADNGCQRSATRAVPASPRRSTHHLKDRRRGRCIESSHARRLSCWTQSRAA